MKSSIFFRLFTTISCALLVIMASTFIFMYALVYNSSVESQRSEMEKACDILATQYAKAEDLSSTRSAMYTMSTTLGARFFITNSAGGTLVCTDVYPCTHVYTSMDPAILEMALTEGKYTEIGHLNSSYSSRFFTCAKPIYKDGECVAYVFASKNTASIDSLVSDIGQIFVVALIIALILTYVLFYFLTYRLTRPLHRLTTAAKKLADGDFSSRVAVTGRDEIAQLSATFNSMAESLESLERMRSSFVANVSHELKTPMTSMSGFIDGILDGTIPPERHRHYLEIVSSETKRLARLVKTLLYLSKIEAGEEKANISDFNYADVVTDVIISLEPRLSEKNMNIEGLDWDNVVMTRADRDMIYQVTYNLVENAIKYSPTDGTITFSFEMKGGKHYISIRNNGSGISKEHCRRIFERFYKVDQSRGLDSKSTGLGLYLVYTLLKIHDQTVTVDSDGSSFVEFTFTLDVI